VTARWCCRRLPLLVLVACSLCARPAYADGAKVLFVSREDTSFSARLRAELESMGFELLEVDQLDEQGRSRAQAAVYVIESPPPRRVELWLENPTNGRLELKTVVESSAGDAIGSDDASGTVRLSERVRAFLQPLDVRELAAAIAAPVAQTRATVSSASLQPKREPTPIPAVSSPRFFEELAPMMALQGGSPGIEALIRGGFWLLPRFAVGGKLAIPLLPSTLKSQGNAATLSTTIVGAELTLLVLQTRALRVGAEAGLALAWLRAVGQPTFGHTNTPDSAFAALPSLGSQLDVFWGSRWHACFGAELGIALPGVEIAFAGRGVAPWGRPLGLLSAGVGLDF
jgi:hypothetical protein